jgi:DNA-binding XRE family transcriptional regulator
MRSIGTGTWDRGWVSGPPLEKVRAHVQQLLTHPDVSLRMVAAAAGVGHTSVELLSRGQMERATGTVVEALAGVTLAAVLRQITNPNQLVSAVGAARRLQALAVDDWGTEEIAGLVGVHPTLVRRHRTGPPYRRISWGYHERYRERNDKTQRQANLQSAADRRATGGADGWGPGPSGDRGARRPDVEQPLSPSRLLAPLPCVLAFGIPSAYLFRLRDRRLSMERSQREVAAAVGIGHGHLSQIEAGVVDPKLSTVRRLADCLGEPL